MTEGSATTAGITFVGTGAIGLPMAEKLIAAGHRVTAVEASPGRRADVVQAGLDLVVDDIAEAPHSAYVVVMVATGDQLADLVDSALAAGVDGQTWIIMSTVGPESVTTEGRRLARAGARVIDAPVTGGVAGARAGTLTIFVSGDPNVRSRVIPLLSACGTPQIVGDEVGMGQAFKVVNQHLCSVHLVAAAEALELAKAMGLDQQRVLDLVSAGAAGSWMLADRGPRMISENDLVTSTVDIFVKDSGLVAAAAARVSFDAPVLAAARARFVAAAEQGRGREDDSVVHLTYR